MGSDLPRLYAAWMEQFLSGPIPPETDATCGDCAMVAGPGVSPKDGLTFFDATTRCCTYLPDLPNYLVGRMLSDPDPALRPGRATIEARLRAGLAVTPLGLGRPPKYELLETHGSSGFGHSRSLRCPHHLDTGACGIWPHRMATCATWFCKYTRGETGRRFWSALHRLLRVVERDLAHWCLVELDVGDKSLRRLFPPGGERPRTSPLDRHALDDRVDAAAYRESWGNWVDREDDFYTHCARRVKALAWRDIVKICGPELPILARLTRAAYQALLADAVPARLTVGTFQVVRTSPESTMVYSYSEYDPLDLDRVLMDALEYFDGRPTEEVLRRMNREKRIRLEEGLIRKLVDFKLLVPADGEP